MKRFVASILAIAMILQLTACTTWRMERPTPALALSADHPRDVRVRLRHDSSTVVIPEARLVGDTIVGWREPPTLRLKPVRVAVPLADVQEVSFRHVSVGRTVLAVGAAAGVTGLLVWAVVAAISGINLRLGGLTF